MNKILLLALVVICSIGCTSTRIPQTTFETPFGQFKGPKDHELEIEGLEFIRHTNGTVMVTAKLIRSKTKNNPKVISASAAQDEANWNGLKGVVEGAIKTGIEAGRKSQGLP
jgi:hypothetical protein